MEIPLHDMDDIDLKIISMLQKDGRITFKEIAKEVCVSERTVRLRIKNLRDNDMIQIIGVVNPIKVGLKLIAMIQIAVIQNTMEDCISALREMDEVRFIALTSGEYQLLLEIVAASHEEFGEFLEKKLNKINGIRKTNVTMELKILKNDFTFVKDKK